MFFFLLTAISFRLHVPTTTGMTRPPPPFPPLALPPSPSPYPPPLSPQYVLQPLKWPPTITLTYLITTETVAAPAAAAGGLET